MIGLPPEGIGIILGVNHFLDMCRTALNVTGDLATAVVVSQAQRRRRRSACRGRLDDHPLQAEALAARTGESQPRHASACRWDNSAARESPGAAP